MTDFAKSDPCSPFARPICPKGQVAAKLKDSTQETDARCEWSMLESVTKGGRLARLTE